jgi:hypothetical protein
MPGHAENASGSLQRIMAASEPKLVPSVCVSVRLMPRTEPASTAARRLT